MKRYYVFRYSTYYPEGGMSDCVLRTDDLDEAKARHREEVESFHHASIWDVMEDKFVEGLYED